jgi:alpha-1,2-mannosyltransferase
VSISSRRLLYLALANAALVVVMGLNSHPGTALRDLANVLRLHFGVDSTRYMDQAWANFHAGTPLYANLGAAGHLKFIYPPSSLLAYSLAILLHVRPAAFIQYLGLVSFLATLWIAGEIFLLTLANPLAPAERVRIRLLIGILGLLFFPLLSGLQVGQIQTFLTFLWTLAIYLRIRRKPALSGICLAITCVFKPMLAVFLLWAALRRQWRFFLAFATGAILLQAAAIALFGWRNEIDYLAALSYIGRHGEAAASNQSVNGLLQSLTRNASIFKWSDSIYPPDNSVVYDGTLVSTAALLAFGLFAPALRRTQDRTMDFIVFGLLATIASPIVWAHHYGYFFAAFVYLLPRISNRQREAVYALMTCYAILSINGIPWAFVTPPWTLLNGTVLYAALGLIILAVLRAEDGNGPSVS